MAQQFDPEVCKKVIATSEMLKEGAVSRITPAFETILEQAQSNNAPALVKDIQSALNEGVPNFLKVYQEMLDCLDEYAAKAKGVLEALGHEF